MRTGIIAKKLGMSRLINETGVSTPITLLAVENCRVVGRKSHAECGFTSVEIGYGVKKKNRVTKPLAGHFAKRNVEVPVKSQEFRLESDSELLDIATELTVEHFQIGQFVDVCGTTIGKGFAGGMKRHNFGGLRASHGVSVSHRSHGSTGNRQDPGRVFKNKKMAGHMGQVRVTTQNLKVVHIDTELKVIGVKGAVPGSAGSLVTLRDAVKKTA